jgi:hypothetical protein
MLGIRSEYLRQRMMLLLPASTNTAELLLRRVRLLPLLPWLLRVHDDLPVWLRALAFGTHSAVVP